MSRSVCIIASYAPSLINFRKDLIQSILKKGYKVCCIAPDFDQSTRDALEKLGCEVKDIALQRTGLNLIKDVGTLVTLFRFFKEYRPDIVLGYTIKPVIYGTIASKFANVPKRVALITGLGHSFMDVDSFKQKIIQFGIHFLYKLGCSSASTVVFQNSDDCKLLVDKKIVAFDKVALVNGSGVNLIDFPKSELPPTKIIRFLMVGRLMKEKGLLDFIEAAKIIHAEYKNVEFDLVGWRDETPSCISQAELDSWVQDGVVNFHGRLDDVTTVVIGCHVYVLPSYREGVPRTVLEAMAVGRAILTTDVPGCRETVKHGINGFLSEVKNPQELSANMKIFIDSPELLKSMGEASYQMVLERFEVNKINHNMMELLGIVD